MHTVQAQIQDDLYEDLVKRGIDIQAKFKEYLFSLTDDGYHSISLDEAKTRVSKAVEDYKNGTMKTIPYSDGMDEIDSWLDKQ
jgi:hypothetical protein